jgi:putative hemolysin
MLGDLPSTGASVQVDGHTITVTELDGRRIARLRIAARLDSSEKSQVEGG